MNQSLTFKILLVGDGAVGKTSLVRRLCRGTYSGTTEETVGVEFMPHEIVIDDIPIKLQIWDTAGQEQYRSLGRAYYRCAVGVLLVFAIDNHNSFESLERWLTDVRSLCHPHARILLVASKSDLEEQRKITKKEISTFVDTFNLEYIESSAKDNVNVEEAFYKLARDVLNAVRLNEIQVAQTPPQLNSKPKNEKKPDSCC